jgi:lipopolysaccharide biosynthesis glycosyltransferase
MMNILYTINELTKDYSRYLWVSIMSLLEHNKDEDINIFILWMVEESNRKELIRIVECYWKKIFFSKWEIIPDKFKEIIPFNSRWTFTTYYRLFFSNCFPEIKDRLLYIDCDTIINKNLKKFYDSDFDWNVFIWTNDWAIMRYSMKKTYWLENYINTWVLLINVRLYKSFDMYNEILKVNEKYWKPYYCDQDYINIIFWNKIMIDNSLQCIVESLWRKYDFSNYLILHTVRKPNEGKLWFCKKEIEELFCRYLKKTKWKSYVSYKQKMSMREYVIFYYKYVVNYIIYVCLKIFWVRIAYYLDFIFYKIWIKFLWK